jgi:hypothetical protein
VNGRLGAQVGILRSAFLTFSIGALVTGLLIVFFAPQQSMTLLDPPISDKIIINIFISAPQSTAISTNAATMNNSAITRRRSIFRRGLRDRVPLFFRSPVGN